MNIEFHTSNGKVSETVIAYVKAELMRLHHKDDSISRAEVRFRNAEGNGSKICEIALTIFRHSIFVNRKGGSYLEASRNTLEELDEKITEHLGVQE